MNAARPLAPLGADVDFPRILAADAAQPGNQDWALAWFVGGAAAAIGVWWFYLKPKRGSR